MFISDSGILQTFCTLCGSGEKFLVTSEFCGMYSLHFHESETTPGILMIKNYRLRANSFSERNISMLSQPLLQSFDLVNRSRDYPSRDHCIASYTGARSRPPSLFNVGFSFLISIAPWDIV